MYSPAIRRVVSRRPPDSNPITASAARSESSEFAWALQAPSGPCSPRIMTRTGTPGVIIRAASASVLAGTSSVPSAFGSAGFQPSSRIARRYLSVATSLMTSPSTSTFTPVITGSVSSRLAAGTTWPIAVASAPPSTVPASRGSSGSLGYSLTGSVTRVNEAGPQVRVTSSAPWSTSTGSGGRLRVISASRRPGTSAVPGSDTSASTRILADTS